MMHDGSMQSVVDINSQRAHQLHSTRPAMRAIKVYAVASDAQVQELQEQFGIPGHVEFTSGQGGLPQVLLKHSCGSKAAVGDAS